MKVLTIFFALMGVACATPAIIAFARGLRNKQPQTPQTPQKPIVSESEKESRTDDEELD